MISRRHMAKLLEESIQSIQAGQETADAIMEKHPRFAGELQTELEAVQWLAEASRQLSPRPGYIAGSRNYLEGRINAFRPHGFWQRLFRLHTPQRWIFNFSAPLILILLLALVVNGLWFAARLSIPGDPLYTTKLISEDMQLALTLNPVHKTNLYIEHSRERATEFIELVLEGEYEQLTPAALRMEAEMITTLLAIKDTPPGIGGSDQAVTAEYMETLSNEILILNTLKATSPPFARPGIDLAILNAQSGLMALR